MIIISFIHLHRSQSTPFFIIKSYSVPSFVIHLAAYILKCFDLNYSSTCIYLKKLHSLSFIHLCKFQSTLFVIHLFVHFSKHFVYNPFTYINFKALRCLPSIHPYRYQSTSSSIIHLLVWILKYSILYHLSSCIDLKALHPLSSIHLHYRSQKHFHLYHSSTYIFFETFHPLSFISLHKI